MGKTKQKCSKCGCGLTNPDSKKDDLCRDCYMKEPFVPNGKNDFDRLIEIIDHYFPGEGEPFRLMLSAYLGVFAADASQPIALWFIAPPSTRKSTLMDIISELPRIERHHDFSPRAFVSAAPGIEDGSREDLLPKLKDKLLVTDELGAWFRSRSLKETMGIFTKVLDGKGFSYATGRGQVGYNGYYFFNWIAGIVRIEPKLWSIFGHLGHRILFYDKTPKRQSTKELAKEFDDLMTKGRDITPKLEICQQATIAFVKSLKLDPSKKIKFDDQKSNTNALALIKNCGLTLRILRATIDIESGELVDITTEAPWRVWNQFTGLAKGSAIGYQRKYITMDDVKSAVKITMDSVPKERKSFFEALAKGDGSVRISQYMKRSKLSRPAALKQFQIMEFIGLVSLDTQKVEPTGRPETVATIVDDHISLLQILTPSPTVKVEN